MLPLRVDPSWGGSPHGPRGSGISTGLTLLLDSDWLLDSLLTLYHIQVCKAARRRRNAAAKKDEKEDESEEMAERWAAAAAAAAANGWHGATGQFAPAAAAAAAAAAGAVRCRGAGCRSPLPQN